MALYEETSYAWKVYNKNNCFPLGKVNYVAQMISLACVKNQICQFDQDYFRWFLF
jgi:hypothetical protein